jgi:hypothetical protein
MPEAESTTETTEQTTVTTPETGDSDDLATLKLTLQKERDARKALEREVKPLRTFKEERTKAEQTADERAAAREKAAEEREAAATRKLQAAVLRDEISAAVTAEKFTLHAPVGDVLRLIDTDAVEWDGETPKNVRGLLRDLVKDRPYLASRRTGSADGGAGGNTNTPKHMDDLIRGAAGRH